MDFYRCVFIRAGSRRGTGYFYNSKYVLTARHVVQGAEKIVLQYDRENQKKLISEARLIWQGEGDLDAAVLETETYPALRDTDLGIDPWTEARPMIARGWVEAISRPLGVHEDTLKSLTVLDGRASGFPRGASELELTIEAALDPVKLPPPKKVHEKPRLGWEGASGGAVFCSGRLVALIKDGNLLFDARRMRAVPISTLWDIPGFRKAIGRDDSADRKKAQRKLAALTEEIRGILEEHSSVSEKVRRLLGPAPIEFGGDLAAELTGVVDALAAFRILDQAHGFYCEKKDVLRASAAEKIINLLGPILISKRTLPSFPRFEGAVVVELPVETATFAEMLLAGHDVRAASWRTSPDDSPIGSGRLPLPLREEGFNLGGQDKLYAYAMHLEKASRFSSNVRKKIARARERQTGKTKLLDLIFKYADIDLEGKAHGARPVRRYLVYDDEFEAEHEIFLNEIKGRLPSIHIAKLSGEDLDDYEEKVAIPLRDLLERDDADPDKLKGDV